MMGSATLLVTHTMDRDTHATVGWTRLIWLCRDAGTEYSRVRTVDCPVVSCVKVEKSALKRSLAWETVMLTECQSPAAEMGVDVRLFDESQELKADKVSFDGATNAST